VEPPGDPPDPAPRSQPEPEPHRCYRCGAPHDPFQEYCLECGARLVPLQQGSWSVWRREAWGRDSPMWFWATFLALLLIALAAAAIVLAATGDDDDPRGRPDAAAAGPTISAVGPPTQTGAITTGTLPETFTFPPPTTGTTIPTFTTTVGDGTTTSATTTTGPTTTTTTTTTTDGSTTVIAWPTGRDGYTVILASYRHSRGRAFAEDRAQEAIADGLRDVGVLSSSRFASLEAGYWVVFYGIHDTESQAVSARTRARNAGYTNAYVREVDPG
jgi:hypothetical protein